jgi:hypothetical protein
MDLFKKEHNGTEPVVEKITFYSGSLLQNELAWLASIISARVKSYFNEETEILNVDNIEPPELQTLEPSYARIIKDLSWQQRTIVILALTPHIAPNFLDEHLTSHISKAGDFPQIGGVRISNFRGFLPTGETAIFLLAGNDLEKRFKAQQLFSADHLLYQKQIAYLEEVKPGVPVLSGRLIVDPEMVELLTTNKMSKPKLSTSFPAELLTTKLEWDDLVLNTKTMEQVKELEVWLTHRNTLMDDWGMSKRLTPGYRALFYGAPGTGKTLTANLLGKFTGRDVYRIDLSTVVSKYIGETEKNLASLFDKAQNKDWILFFDEADALFGKRTNVRDAHDKYANQEVAYLLQRIESYSGLVILASNFKNNIDDAFIRRFQSIIYFPNPKPQERMKLWKNAFPEKVKIEEAVSLEQLSHQYEVNGANIMNIVQHACLKALERKDNTILAQDILQGIAKEYAKEGKMF